MVSYRAILDNAFLGSSTVLFANLLSQHPVSDWEDIIQTMTKHELKALLPNNDIIAQFLRRLVMINAQSHHHQRFELIFLNSLGPKFEILFENHDAFPELLENLQVLSRREWIHVYVPHIYTLAQLIPLFQKLTPALRFDLIRVMGNRIYLLDDPFFSNSEITEILNNSTIELMFWTYFKENHVISFLNHFKTGNVYKIVYNHIYEVTYGTNTCWSWFCKAFSRANNTEKDDRQDLLDKLFKCSISLEEIQIALLKELKKTGTNNLNASMTFVYCYEVVTDVLKHSININNVFIDSNMISGQHSGPLLFTQDSTPRNISLPTLQSLNVSASKNQN